MANKHKKIVFFAVLVFSAFLLFATPQFAHAQVVAKAASVALGTLGDIAFTLIGKIVFAITYLFTWIGGVFVAIAAWGVSVFLQMNTGLVNSNVVQFGFPVTLSIANLGFVLAIIVIAIATILRQQSYGIKSMLTKVVIMAVLVNFGLVLAGGILNFSDTISNSFLEQISPAGSGNSYNDFASSLAGAFNPQKAFLFGMNSATSTSGDAAISAKLGSTFGSMLVPIVGALFGLASIAIMLITLVALIVMLIIRYVTLGILLVLLPIAWMLFVFPSFKKHYDTWWNSFLKNAFFPPVVLFFLWLGIKVSESMSSGAGGVVNMTLYQSTSSNPVWSTVANLLTNLATPLLTSFMQAVMLGGIMIGGLFAANKMGITFADTGMKWASGAKNYALGKVGRGAKRAITAPIRGARAQDFAERMLKSSRPGAVGYIQRLTGRGVAAYGRVGGANLVKEWEDKNKKLSKEQFFENMRASPLGTSPQEDAANLKIAAEKGWIKDFTEEDYKKFQNKDQLAMVGAASSWDDINKASIGSHDSKIANNLEAALRGDSAAKENLREAMKEIGGKTGKGDAAKMDFQTLFSAFKKDAAGNRLDPNEKKFGLDERQVGMLRKSWLEYIQNNNPSLTASILPKLKGDSLDGFQKEYGEQLDAQMEALRGGGASPVDAQLADLKKQADEARAAMKPVLAGKLERDYEELKKTGGGEESQSEDYKKLKRAKEMFENAVGFNATTGGSEPAAAAAGGGKAEPAPPPPPK